MDNLTSRPFGSISDRNSRSKAWLLTAAIVLLAPLIALFFTTFIFQTYEVDGISMQSTLQNHDRLIILKAPQSFAKLVGQEYIPHRYDIIVFNSTDALRGAGKKQLIKRVIGLPGDRLIIKGGVVTIYNAAHPTGVQVDKEGPQAGVVRSTPGNFMEVIEPDHVFVMGDNRENSLSSVDFGAVPSNDIVGKLIFRIYPLDKIGKM